MEQIFETLACVFALEGDIKSVKTISNGNINQTFDVKIQNGDKEDRYVFQKLNIYVFKNPEQIMQNIDKITSHIAKKLDEQGRSRDCVMHFISCADGKNYYIDGEDFWRICEYVPNSTTYNLCDDLDILCSAGAAFGDFQTLLADFSAKELYHTIPDFHNTRARIQTLMRHAEEDPCSRVEIAKDELLRIKEYTPLATKLCDLTDSGELPLRVTHNDTKINNVLFDKDTGKAKTVIDLDTVMPGLVAHDFGDAVRFAANTAAEDEQDISLISLDMDRFSAFAKGFVPKVSGALTEMEIKTLSLGAFTMAVELAARFLDDYLTGDKYFKTLYSGHNLVRVRAQLALADDIFKKLDGMNDIVINLC